MRLQTAKALAWSGDLATARRLFHQAAADDPTSLVPWIELAAMADSPEESRRYLAEVLSREPNHAGARKCLNHLEAEHRAALSEANAGMAASPRRHERATKRPTRPCRI